MRSPPTNARCTRALNELIRGLPFPRTETIGDVYIDDFAILGICNFQTCMSIRRPLKRSVPMLCTTSFRCPRMRASLAVHSRESSEEGTTASQTLSVSLWNAESCLCSSRCWSLPQERIGASSNASSGEHLPSRSGEKHLLASTTLQPRLWLHAGGVE